MSRKTKQQWPYYWSQLSVMIGAGLPIDGAISTLIGKDKVKQSASVLALKRVHGLVKRGQSLSSALKKNACISATDFVMLNIAEKAGKLPDGLNLIANRRSDWQLKVNTLKANLMLPKGMLLVGALAGLFVRVASAGQPLSVALTAVISTLIVAWLVVWLTVWLVEQDSLVWLSLGWRFQFIRQRWLIYQLVFEESFYRLLGWQIGAGIAPDKALLGCEELLSASDYRKRVVNAAGDAANGESADDLLSSNGLVLSRPLKRVLVTSMQVGSWDVAVMHHLNVQKKYLALKADDFFKWLPRFYYLVALLAISKYMFV